MRDDSEVPEDDKPRHTLALALIDVELNHHLSEAQAHVHVGLDQPQLRRYCYRAARIHGLRLRVWRRVRALVVAQEF